MAEITFDQVARARERIGEYIVDTPVFRSELLDNWLGHRFLFKAECLQRVGAFKARGACNAICRLVEEGRRPARIVAQSSGNHAQATAWASARFGLPATIVMPREVSSVKAQATAAYGATVEFMADRQASESRIAELASRPGSHWVHPYDDADVITGQGTVTLDALRSVGPVDLIAAPCGGGGLVGGGMLAARELAPSAEVVGVEPQGADDAAQSVAAGRIVSLARSPDTVADGVRTLSVGQLNLPLLRQLAGIEVVPDSAICYWTQWLSHLLKLHLEPTAALGMAGAVQRLRGRESGQRVLVVLSGGNCDARTTQRVWSTDHLETVPQKA